MPHLDVLAKAVVEEICNAFPQGTMMLKTIPDGETIEPGYDVKGYHVEIIPMLLKSSTIVVHAPSDAWEANVGFGDHGDMEVWYKKGPDADREFMDDLKAVLKTVMASHWKE
jgi:hypothetical protein